MVTVDVQTVTDSHVRVIISPIVSDARHRPPVSTTIDAIRRQAISFGFGDLDQELIVDIDLKRNASPRRHAPKAPVEFYEARLSFADLIRPLFLGAVDLSPLRAFQSFGVSWLISTKRAILADDMGLGKTIQAIFGVRMLIRTGEIQQAVVVCPGILIPNWLRELSKWAPELSVCVMQPPEPARAEAWRAMKGRMHVLLTTYDQLRVAAPKLKHYPADCLILDEAHRLRNPQSQTSAAVRALKATYVWALTGTPIERHPEDLIALMNVVCPGFVGVATAQQGAAAVRARARPLILRRLKADVVEELPGATEDVTWLALTADQRRSYNSAFIELSAKVSKFALLSRLRKICDADPRTSASAKIDFLVNRSQDIVKQSGEKVVVFSISNLPLELARQRLLSAGVRAHLLTGKVPQDEREVLLQDFKDGGPSVLLASAKLASEGLTLTEASHVFFLNLWWNPSTNNQARDRVMRIGQKSKVAISSLLCADTIDEEVHKIVQRKSGVYRSITDMLSVIDPELLRPRL